MPGAWGSCASLQLSQAVCRYLSNPIVDVNVAEALLLHVQQRWKNRTPKVYSEALELS